MRFCGLMSTSLYKYSVSSIRASEAGFRGLGLGARVWCMASAVFEVPANSLAVVFDSKGTNSLDVLQV